MTEVIVERVALLGPDGKLPDSTTPGQVLDILVQIQQIQNDIQLHLDQMLKRSLNLSDLESAVAARQNIGAAALEHQHEQSDILGLSEALDVKADLVNGVVPTSQIPTRALVRAFPVANEAEMLALTEAEPGDVAVRAEDGAGTFMLLEEDASQIGSWTLLASPQDAVISVNEKTGGVVLGAADVGAPTVAQLDAAINGVKIEADGFAELAAGSAQAASNSAQAASTSAFNAGQARVGAETALNAVPGAVTEQVTSQVEPQVTAATTAKNDAVAAKNDAVAAKNDAEKARDETEQIYVALGSINGTKTLTLAETNKPTGWDATLTANTDFVLPSLGNRILTCSLYLVAGTAGVTYRILGGETAYSTGLIHTGTVNAKDLIHLLHYGPRGWIVLPGAPALGVPSGWVS